MSRISQIRAASTQIEIEIASVFVSSDELREVTRIDIELKPKLFCLSASTSNTAIPAH